MSKQCDPEPGSEVPIAPQSAIPATHPVLCSKSPSPTLYGAVSTDWDDPGNWATGVPQSGEKARIIAGSPRYPIIDGTPANFDELQIETGGVVTVVDGGILNPTVLIDIQSGGSLHVNGGIVKSNNLDVLGDCFVRDSGTLRVLSTATVAVGGLMDVREGIVRLGRNATSGALSALGTLVLRGVDEDHRAVIRAKSDSAPMDVVVSGTIDFNYFRFEGLDSNGLVVGSPISIEDFQRGRFMDGAASGKYVDFTGIDVSQFSSSLLDGNNNIVLNDLAFVGDGIDDPSTNVEADSQTANIIFRDYGGILGGVAFESDPNQKLTWEDRAPNPPQALTSTAVSGGVFLSWAANAESFLGGYNLYRSTTQGVFGPTDIVNSGLIDPEDQSFLDNDGGQGLAAGTYHYVLTAVNEYDVTLESAWSNEVNDGPLVATGGTTISADITEDKTWTIFGSPYSITAAIEITGDAVLNVEAGVQISFQSGSSLTVSDNASLICNGTSASPVLIDPDYLLPNPVPFLIAVGANNSGDGVKTLDLTYTNVTLGRVEGARRDSIVSVNHCVFNHNETTEAGIQDVNAFEGLDGDEIPWVVRNSTFRNFTGYGVDILRDAVVQGCTFDNLGDVGLEILGGLRVNPRSIDALSGLIFSGGNQVISIQAMATDAAGAAIHNVDFETTIRDFGVPYSTEFITTGCLVFKGTQADDIPVTVQSGVEIDFAMDDTLALVDANLYCQGSIANPVVLTSADGGSPGDWTGILAQDSGEIQLDFCEIEFATNAINVKNVDLLNVADSTMKLLSSSGVLLDPLSREATFVRCTFENIVPVLPSDFGIGVYRPDQVLGSPDVTFDVCDFRVIAADAIRSHEIMRRAPPIQIPTIQKITNCTFESVGNQLATPIIHVPAYALGEFTGNDFLDIDDPWLEVGGRCWRDISFPKMETSDAIPKLIRYRIVELSAHDQQAGQLADHFGLLLDDRESPISMTVDAGVVMEIVDPIQGGDPRGVVEGFSQNLLVSMNGTQTDPITVDGKIGFNGAIFDWAHGELDLSWVQFTNFGDVNSIVLKLQNAFGTVSVDQCDFSQFDRGVEFINLSPLGTDDRTIPIDLSVTNSVFDDCTLSVNAPTEGVAVHQIRFEGCEFNSGPNGSGSISGADLTFIDCSYQADDAMQFVGGDNVISRCDLLPASTLAVDALFDSKVLALCNWWGAAGDPTLGQEVSGDVQFDAWLDGTIFGQTDYFENVTLSVPQTDQTGLGKYFNNVGKKTTVTFGGDLSASESWTITVKDSLGAVKWQDSTGSGSQIAVDWDGTDTVGNELAAATYDYEIDVTSSSNYPTVKGKVTIDTGMVRGAIVTPQEGTTVFGPTVAVTGIATGADDVTPANTFLSYKLYYGIGPKPQAWAVIDTDNQIVDPAGSLTPNTAWDVSSLEPGTYTLRLEVLGQNGARDFETTRTIVLSNVDIDAVSAYRTNASEPLFDPYASETAKIEYTLSEGGTVRVEILDAITRNLVRTLVNDQTRAAGVNIETWDGRDDASAIVPDAAYVYEIRVVNTGSTKSGVYAPEYIPGDVAMSWVNFDDEFQFHQRPYMGGGHRRQSFGLALPRGRVGRGLSRRHTYGFRGHSVFGRDVHDSSGRACGGRNLAVRVVVGGQETYVQPYTYTFSFVNRLPDNFVIVGPRTDLVLDAGNSPYVFRPSLGQISTVCYELSQAADVSVDVVQIHNDGVNPPTVPFSTTLQSTVNQPPGVHCIDWDGQDGSGMMPPPGDCTYIIQVTDPVSGRSETIRGNVTVER